MNSTGIIILAGGSSSRLGTAKQLLHYQGKTLLNHIVEQALACAPAAVVVVLGARADEIATTLTDRESKICYNADWETGMASSIRAGMLQLLQDNPKLKNCLVSVCDQPYIRSENLLRLIARQSETGKGIVASSYADAFGVPVLFTQPYFAYLTALEGEQGAKKIMEQHQADMAMVSFKQGALDIDRPADLRHLSNEMLSVSEAQEIIKKNTSPSVIISKSLEEASACIVAESVISLVDIPGFRQSSMDGYAIRFEDRFNNLTVVGEMRAGQQAVATLSAGQAIRVFTGAPLPEGADTVVMQEKVNRDQDRITVKDEQLQIGIHVREKGSEAAKGALALAAGTSLTAAAIGFLAGIGCDQVSVYGPPKVAIIVTGDELQELGKPLAFGQVYESNALQLRVALKKAGVVEINRYHAPDDPAVLEVVLADALAVSDLVLLVGGVSVGDYDFVVQCALAQAVQPHFHKVKQKPGKPLFFGTKGEKMVFGLPGNPSSALTCFYLYVLPAIDRIMQRPATVLQTTAITTAAYSKNRGLTHFIKAQLQDGKVVPLHAQESYRLHSYAQANCLLILDEQSDGAAAGDDVQVILLP